MKHLPSHVRLVGDSAIGTRYGDPAVLEGGVDLLTLSSEDGYPLSLLGHHLELIEVSAVDPEDLRRRLGLTDDEFEDYRHVPDYFDHLLYAYRSTAAILAFARRAGADGVAVTKNDQRLAELIDENQTLDGVSHGAVSDHWQQHGPIGVDAWGFPFLNRPARRLYQALRRLEACPPVPGPDLEEST